MIEDVCPATPPYRHLAALVEAVDDWINGRGNAMCDGDAIGKTHAALMECPACMAAIGEEGAE